jgi:outer membrane receptor protein involved in Fe transport
MKIFIKNLFLFALVILVKQNIYGQNSIISGVVNDIETRQKLANVQVNINQLNVSTTTDAFGKFSFAKLPDGNYELSFKKVGYINKKINVSADVNATKEVTIELAINSITLTTIEISADRPVSAASSKYLSSIDFDNRPKNSAQDMLRLVPGLFIAQHAGGGKAEQIFIRGFDCDHGTDVAAFVDGIPVNMPSHGHGQGYLDLHFLIPESVKEMEIFKGPYSPKYGNFSTAAAVQFKTADTLQNNLLQVEMGGTKGINDITNQRVLTMVQIPDLSKNITSYFVVDLISNRSYFNISQEFKRFNLLSKTVFKISNESKLSLILSSFGSSWDASGQVPERAVRSGFITRFGAIDPTEGGATSRNNINLIYKTSINGGALETQVYTSSYRFKLFSNFSFNFADSINGDGIEQGDNRTIRGMNTNFSKSHLVGKMNSKFTIGASFRNDEIDNGLWTATKRKRLETTARANVNEISTGFFVNEAIQFNEHFRLELGGRYDYFIFNVEDLLPTDSTRTNYSGYNYQTLLSPKVNFSYSVSDKLQFFLNGGYGFHSNDSRSSVQEPDNHDLPLSAGAELGSLFHIGNQFVVSLAAWTLDLENELVYVGDDGTTENKGSSRRMGIDFSARYKITSWLTADADVNVSKNVFTKQFFGSQQEADFNIPLAPTATSTGGLTVKHKNIESGLRYRLMADRPANESNSVVALGYNILDFSINYKKNNLKIGLIMENILDVDWNEAQFDTESRLPFESVGVSELHFTPGTPLNAKIVVGYMF